MVGCCVNVETFWEVIDGFKGEEQDFTGNAKFEGEPLKMLQDKCYLNGGRISGKDTSS